ncbi:hypothetical protein V8F33_004803 [Rhypophila sp. PSN 637]
MWAACWWLLCQLITVLNLFLYRQTRHWYTSSMILLVEFEVENGGIHTSFTFGTSARPGTLTCMTVLSTSTGSKMGCEMII